VALRDLFDSDSRSKQQLRDEILNLNLRLKNGATDLDIQRAAHIRLTMALSERDAVIANHKTEIERVVTELVASKSDVVNLEVHVKNQVEARGNLKADFEQLKALYSNVQKELDAKTNTTATAFGRHPLQ
jgi:chromosome segregation ATPase